MNSIKELQHDINNDKVSCSAILRKAKIIASKLGQEDFSKWIDKELNGYADDDSVPEYRIIKGVPQGFNPYRGWIPYINENSEIQEQISRRGINQSISQLEDLTDKNSLMVKFPPKLEQALRKGIKMDVDLRLSIDKSAVVGIINNVRNEVLNWSLKLEKVGVSTEETEFSNEEKTEAQGVEPKYSIQNIENFNGNMGDFNKFNNGALVPQETILSKFFWYVVVAFLVIVIGNVVSELIIKSIINKN